MNSAPIARLRARSARNAHSNSGDTLLEVLITLVVISLCVVAFLSAFTTTISASAEHRTLVSMDALLRSVSENAVSQIQQQPSPLYVSCAIPSNYGSVKLNPPTNYTATISSVAYWNGSSFGSTCVSGSTAPELVGISVSGPLGSSSSITIAVDDPAYAG